MVVAVVDEVIWDCVPVIRVELLEEGLGSVLLLLLKLLNEIVSLHLTEATHLAQVKVMGNGLEDVLLIGTDGCLSWLTIRSVDGGIDPIVPNPLLRRHWDAGMTLRNTRMTALDIGVRESCAWDASCGSASRCTNGVVSPSATDTQGGALLPDVPTDTREEFNAAAKTKEAHGIRAWLQGWS